MDRDNFYLLLNLPLDPPESDKKKIEAVINRMQATWSRYRSHPSKGIQAKKYIGMIPEIRRTMADPDLRKKEADAAIIILKRRKRKKFAQVDRHLKLRMSKGFITDEEISKLAGMHKLSDDAIRKRIGELKVDMYAEIDENIHLRLAKGYVTKGEIASIAKRYGIKPQDVRNRIKGPIREDSEAADDEVQRLDRSVAQNISTNLKIVGKSDLYDFLDLERTASKRKLVARARQKDAEIQNIGKKDANVTAGMVLVGLCISIFKSDAYRRGYDMILARSRFTNFDADIDVAGMDGQIRAEYFDILVERGTEFGMDHEEAGQYIRDYCEKKGWTIVKPRPEKKGLSKKFIIAAVAGLLIVIAGGGAFRIWQNSTRSAREFQRLISTASQVADPMERAILYQTYLNSRQQNEFTSQIQQKLKATQDEIDKQAFETLTREADQAAQNSLETALKLYDNFLKNTSQGPFANKARQQREALKGQIDERDYRQTLIPQKTAEKMAAYSSYLASHPQGKYADKIKELLIEMSEEYYLFTKKNIENKQNQEAWDECLGLVEGYLAVYAENRHTMEMKELRDLFRIRLRDARAFLSLQAESRAYGENLKEARRVFRDYLSAYPDTTARVKVENEIQQIDQRMKQVRLDNESDRIKKIINASKDRFRMETAGTMVDSKSGLMWTLLDSKQDTTQCLNYADAKKYLEKMKVGQYSDWRMPTIEELTTLFAEEITFPVAQGEWFWTSESYTRYADGWITEVRTLEKQTDSQWLKNKRDGRECGAVRGVRP